MEAERVLVVGAGAAGCLAALRLASRGISVTLHERDCAGPSLTAICGGLVPGVNTPQQRVLGVVDSVDLFVSDVMAKNKGHAQADLVAAVAEVSASALGFFEAATGVPLHLYTDVLHPGLSVPRLHATPGESGHELQDALRRAAFAHPGIEVREREFIDQLSTDAGGSVTGAGPARGRAVVLATGGFGANKSMLRRWIPAMADAEYVGSRLSGGELIEAAAALGAQLVHMGGFQGHAHVNPGGRTHLGGSLPRLGAIMVNLAGRRFGAEDGGYSEFALDVLRQPQGRAVEIFDESMLRQAESLGVFREAMEAGAVLRAGSARELAAAFGIDAAALAAEIARYNGFVAAGADADWGRRILPRQLGSPLYGSLVTGALAHTQGGLRIDACGRVLGRDGDPIRGLYAVGGAAACFSGDGAEGYLSGNGLAHAFGTAWLAAEHISGARM